MTHCVKVLFPSIVSWYAISMNYRHQFPRSNLKAILQQHYRRFIVSADFITLPNGEIVVEVIFDNGEREFISRGHEPEGYNNENPRNPFRTSTDLSLAPA